MVATQKSFLLFISLHLALLNSCINSLSSSSEPTSFSVKLVRKNIAQNKSIYYFPNTINPRITLTNSLYTVEANIGTPSTKKTFIFDTGSELTWTQCTPCVNCFKQDSPLFDPKKSTSYKKLAPNHPYARYFNRSNNGDSSFHLLYKTGESSSGIVSTESFSFPSDKRGSREIVKGLVFGCANNQKGKFAGSITGVMGMNRSPLSLVGQVGAKLSQKFSYCLPPITSSVKTTLLRFGNNVKTGRGLRETSFINNIDYNYRVNLLDISISGRRLNLPNGTFTRGCMIDVGSTGGYLETRAYNEVVRVLTRHFERFKLQRVDVQGGLLCYRIVRAFRNYPNMVFHFQGGDFEIGKENLFHFSSVRFCLAMQKHDEKTALGSFQQQNVRFVYDIGNQKVLFGKEECLWDRG
ncbi:hypothetical protein ABFS82_13G056900 [Erythranthe guttata]|nr:PREDICTED: aspartic proteinase nepenthesin-1-like [Erythranthe guttata]|eukprot:XP_012847233.1 PREDICTED: aspartic proteinase nepenthesin-1-like [Erythranthe guttata]